MIRRRPSTTESRAASTAGTMPLARPMPAATSMPQAMTVQGMLLVCNDHRGELVAQGVDAAAGRDAQQAADARDQDRLAEHDAEHRAVLESRWP